MLFSPGSLVRYGNDAWRHPDSDRHLFRFYVLLHAVNHHARLLRNNPDHSDRQSFRCRLRAFRALVDGTIHSNSSKASDSLNTAFEAVDAEALFGSAARRDSDAFSDIDYLIVGEKAENLRSRKWWLAGQGFSVSDYTWNRLERAFAAGTLFALHLTLEARPIIDRTGRLRDLFRSFYPKASYESDYYDSLQLFRPLERVPASLIGRAWALDTLAVAFRNTAITLLARDGRYVFSMNSIVNELRTRGKINREQAASLHSLRTSKARYRSGFVSHVGRHQLDGALRAVGTALKLDFQVADTALPHIIYGHNKSSSAYARMRSIEAELISVPAGALSHPEASQIRNDLLRTVRDPHAYLWRLFYEADNIEANLSRLRAFY